MKHATSRTLFDYWNKVRGARKAPRRFEIEPARLAGILPESFILEQAGADAYRFRLAGTRLCEQFGVELRGRNFLEPWDEQDRSALRRRLAAMAEQGAVCLFEFEAYGPAQRAVHFEVLMVPLVQRDAVIDRFLGAMSTNDEPAWLGTERLDRRQLLRHELIWPDGLPPGARLFRPVPLPQVRDARLVRSDRRSFRVYEGGLSHQTPEKG
ncbi:MAG: PAS domain-containing protein [Hyphomicrobiaceae bacterium]|nr:PAS domain-containing protein [Hyphomicrobiaceae bacterium]